MPRSTYTLLIFPILLIAASISSVYFKYLTLTKAILLSVPIFLVYLLIIAIIIGCFYHPYPKEIMRGPFTYYYTTYQAAYWDAAKQFNSLFGYEENKLIADKVKFLAFYWDVPSYLVDTNMCRSLFGFITKGRDIVVDRVCRNANLKQMELPQWKAVEAGMRIIVEITYALAPMILTDPIIKYVVKRFPHKCKSSVMYEHCDWNITSYGYIVSENQEFFNNLKPYPDPELNDVGRKEMFEINKNK